MKMLWRPLGSWCGSCRNASTRPQIRQKVFPARRLFSFQAHSPGSHRRRYRSPCNGRNGNSGQPLPWPGRQWNPDWAPRTTFRSHWAFPFADLRAHTGQCRKFRKAAQRMDHAGQPFAGAPQGCPRRWTQRRPGLPP